MKQNLEQPIFYAVQHLRETKTQEVKFSYIVDTKHMLISWFLLNSLTILILSSDFVFPSSLR